MRPHFSALHFLAPVQGAFAIAQVELLRENPQHPRKDDYVKPKSRNAFSFRISGRTSSRMAIFSKSVSQRSGAISGLSEPNSTLCLSKVFAYYVSLGRRGIGKKSDGPPPRRKDTVHQAVVQPRLSMDRWLGGAGNNG
jgi:hypothetical protein